MRPAMLQRAGDVQSYVGERAASKNGELSFVILLGFLHGGGVVCGMAALGWCCYQCGTGSCSQTKSSLPPANQPGSPRSNSPAAGGTNERQPQSVPALAAPGAYDDDGGVVYSKSAVKSQDCLSEEARLLSLNITYLRELATSILTMDERIDEVNATMAKQQELLERALSMQAGGHHLQTDLAYPFSSPVNMEQTMPSGARVSMSPSLRDMRQSTMFGSRDEWRAVGHSDANRYPSKTTVQSGSSTSSSDEELRNEAAGEGRRRVPPNWIGRG